MPAKTYHKLVRNRIPDLLSSVKREIQNFEGVKQDTLT